MKPVESAIILLVDDDLELMANLAAWLEAASYSVLRATSGQEAMRQARHHPVDVAVVDLQMPGLSGLQVLDLLKELDPRIEVVIFSGQATFDDAVASLRHGRAFDLLQKPLRDPQQLLVCLEKALLRRRRGNSEQLPTATEPLTEEFTDREREFIALLAEGAGTREIATALCLSEKTVRNYLSKIYAKLGVAGRSQAIIASQRRRTSR